MKRIMIIILAFSVMFIPFNVFASSEPTIVIGSANAKAGESVDIVVSMKNNPGIVTMRLDVTFDDEVMELTNVLDHGLLPGKVHGNDKTAVPYCLFWDNGSSTEDFIVDGNLATLTFTLKSDVPDGKYPITISYDYENFDIFNMSFEPISFNVDNGSITVSSTANPQIVATNFDVKDDTSSFDLELISSDDIKGVVIVATYGDNKSTLCNVNVIEDVRAKMEGLKIENKGGKILQVMWWESLATTIPISGSLTINLTE